MNNTPPYMKTLARQLATTPKQAHLALIRWRVEMQLSVNYNTRKRRWFISLPLKNAQFTYLICTSAQLADYMTGKEKLWIPTN